MTARSPRHGSGPERAPADPGALLLHDLSAGRGAGAVIRKIDLQLSAGTVTAVLGPNGAGKSTLLETVAGLLPRLGGRVTVGGVDLRSGHPGAARRAGVVLVPDDRALFGSLTVRENLAAARGRRGLRPEAALELVPALEKRWSTAAGSLSGGEQQMLALARALVQEPRVLLVDEMSMGLAPVIVDELLPIVRSIATQTHAVVVIVEQHVHLALEVADRAVVMVRGEVVLQAPAHDLRTHPEHLESVYLRGATTV